MASGREEDHVLEVCGPSDRGKEDDLQGVPGEVMQKPDSCKGCPFYSLSKAFVPDLIRPGSRLTVLEMLPGKDDERGEKIVGYDGKHPVYESVGPRPLNGATGHAIRETYLPLTGLKEEEVSFCSVLKCRVRVTGELQKEAIEHCTREHLRIPESTELIVAHGGPAFEVTQPILTAAHKKTKKTVSKEGEREKGGIITTWRGFVGPETYQGKQVFGVGDVADLFRDPTQRVTTRMDWKRIGRYLRGDWPKPIPERLIASGESPADLDALNRAFDAAESASFIAVDTEFGIETKFLSLIGIGWEIEGKTNGIQLQWTGNDKVTPEARSTFIRRFSQLIKKVKVVFQNAKADLVVIDRNMGLSWERRYLAGIEDTMHMHSVLWSEMPHGLEFLASIYGQYPKLKHLMHVDELLYNWGDVIETIEVYKALALEFKADPLTEGVYRSQSLPLIPITLHREVVGIRVNQERLEQLITEYGAKVDEFDRLAGIYAGYPINLMSTGSEGQLAEHLRTYEGISLKSVDEETIAAERDKFLHFDREYEEKNGFTPEYVLQRVEEGAHPLLELRAAGVHYKQLLNQDLLPLRGKERVHPSFRHDAQASGRWSTTKPALAKVPNDLLDLYIPDPGHILFGADFDAQEPRIFMAEANSKYLKAAFDEGLDIHTLLVCDMFGWPHPPNKQNPHNTPECAEWREMVGWGGKEDKRRTVSKNVRYERYYMGTGKNAIDKAVKLGLPKEALARASRLVIEQDSGVANFHREIKKLAKTKRIRTWTNRLRVFMGTGEKVEREMCNQKMQGGGVDILNLTIIEVTKKYPFARLFYTRHDSFWFEIPVALFTPEVAEDIKKIAEQPRLINGQLIPFPGSWKVMDEKGEIKSFKFTKEGKVAA